MTSDSYSWSSVCVKEQTSNIREDIGSHYLLLTLWSFLPSELHRAEPSLLGWFQGKLKNKWWFRINPSGEQKEDSAWGHEPS